MRNFILIFILMGVIYPLFSQPKPLSSSEIYLNLQKLATVGNVMYIAAHPDDENTLLITWLSKDKKVRTAYFSMTRGDGGQNLIGSEKDEYVGLLRTHELLEARKIDGGEQYFSRAVDFGFSKSTDETLKIWGKEKILSDLVYRIRKFKPDVIINRFPPDERAGHGHHSASAVLSIEAFDAAADPSRFPEQLNEVDVWQPKRLVWNTFSRGFTNSAPEGEPYIEVSIGGYNPLLGKSYPEIAAEARSKHRSQGFGSAPTRNERFDYLVGIKGEAAKDDLFDGIDLTWNRVEGGKEIGVLINRVINEYDFKSPDKSLPALLKIYEKISSLKPSVYKEQKLEECRTLISACAGLYLEVNSSASSPSAGDYLKLNITAVKRTDFPVVLQEVHFSGIISKDTLLKWTLENNKSVSSAFSFKIPNNTSFTQPYWLHNTKKLGEYIISEETLRNLPMGPDALNATFKVNLLGQDVLFNQPVKYKYTEPSRGEIYKYLEIRPKVMVNFEQNVLVFENGQSKKVGLVVKSNVPSNEFSVKLDLPTGWQTTPKAIEVNLNEKDEEKVVYFTVTPPLGSSEAVIKAAGFNKSETFDRSFKQISYEHIPELNIFPEASAKALNLDLKITNSKIAYVMGAGDDVPFSLTQMGYQLEYLDENSIKDDLTKYDAIIIGVRAYNTKDWLANSQKTLLDYVKNGGNLVVQYQTQAFYGTIKTEELGPFPLTIGRGRVTDEHAKVNFINPGDSLLNYPNKITESDFEGWIQERGLYFAEKWADNYRPIFSMNDAGEEALLGSLLYTKYGKGNYIFTGLSLFRQLPAGVPGAFKLMANMISLK